MTTILKDLQWRYAVKKFDTERKLTSKQIDLLKDAFQLTPTSYGLQPIRLVIVENEAMKEKLFPYSYSQEQITTCSHLLVITAQTDFGAKDIERFIALNIAAMPEKSAYFEAYGKTLTERFAQKTKDEILEWAVYQSFIGLGNLIDVCAVTKIDACPMTGFEPEKFDQMLGLSAQNLTAVSLLPVGYRAVDDRHQFDPKVRRPLQEMVIEI